MMKKYNYVLALLCCLVGGAMGSYVLHTPATIIQPESILDIVTEIENVNQTITEIEDINQTISEETEVTSLTDVTIPQFETVSNTNDDLEDLTQMRNIGHINDNYFAKINAGDLEMYSAASLTAASVLENSRGFIYTGAAVGNLITRSLGTHAYSMYMSYVTNIVGEEYAFITTSYTQDSGDNFAGQGQLINVATQPETIADVSGVDLFKSGANWYAVFTVDVDGVYDVWISRVDADTKAERVGFHLKTLESIYAGYVNANDDYVFVTHDDDDIFYKVIFDVSTGLYSHTTLSGLTAPSSWDVNTQQYWKHENVELLMDQDHLYTRVGTNAWQLVVATGTTTNGVIWGYDANGNLIIVYLIWKDTIYEVTEGGGLGPMQDTFEEAYVGWSDWFANGSDAIYQMNHSSERYGHTLKFTEVLCKYKDGVAEITDSTDYRPKVIDWGTWNAPDLSAWTINANIDTSEIVKEQSGRKNVLHVIGDVDEEHALPFTARDAGEVECYVELAQTNKILYIRLDSTAATSPCQIEFQSDGNIDFTGATTDTDIQAYVANTLYHIRLVYLINGDCDLYLNGTLISTITGNNVQADQFYIVPASADTEFYLDSLGFSQDDYITYSNLLKPWKKGDFISMYDYRHELGFKGFVQAILDNDARSKTMVVKAGWRLDLEKEITYSLTTTPDVFLPAIAAANFEYSTFSVLAGGGTYTQEWTELETLGKLDNIVKRETWVWYADIRTNIIYLDDGTELAVFDYKRGIPGVVDWGVAYDPDLSAWVDSSGAGCTVSIVAEVDGHKNPMELDDQSANQCNIIYSFSNQPSGIVELFIRMSDTTDKVTFWIGDGGATHAILMKIEADQLQYFVLGWANLKAVTDNIWYHLKITFDVAGTWSMEVDGVSVGSGLSFRGSPSNMDEIVFQSDTTDTDYQTYLDALTLSWDGALPNRTLYSHAQSVGAKFGEVIPKTNTNTIARGVVTGKVVNGIPTKGTFQSPTVGFGDTIKDSEPDEGDKTVLDGYAENLVTQGDTEYLEVVAILYLQSPVQWGRQIYFDYPVRRFDYDALGGPDLYYGNKGEYKMVANEQRLGMSSALLFTYAKTTVQEGQTTVEMANSGITPNVNQTRIFDVEDRVTWPFRDVEAPIYDDTDLVNDALWNDYDLSAILGPGKWLVYIHAEGIDNQAGSNVFIRPNGFTTDEPWKYVHSILANNEAHDTRFVPTDDDGIIEIKCDPAPSSWTAIEIFLLGKRKY